MAAETTGENVPAEDLNITEEDLDLLESDDEPSSEPEASDEPQGDLASRMKAAKINESEIPSEIKNNPSALETFVSSVEERQKDFQKQWTQKNQQASEEVAKYKQDAEAFRVLVDNPDFQSWVQEYQQNQSGGNKVNNQGGKISLDDAPDHLQGEALLDWWFDQKLQAMGIDELKTLPQRVDALQQHLTANQIHSLKQQYPDFEELQGDIGRVMQENNIRDPHRAYRIVKAENTPDEQTLRQQIKQEMLEEIQQKKQATGGITRGTGGSNTVTRPSVESDEMRTKSRDELFQEVVDQVRSES